MVRPSTLISPGFMPAGQGPAYFASCVALDSLMPPIGGENVVRDSTR